MSYNTCVKLSAPPATHEVLGIEQLLFYLFLQVLLLLWPRLWRPVHGGLA